MAAGVPPGRAHGFDTFALSVNTHKLAGTRWGPKLKQFQSGKEMQYDAMVQRAHPEVKSMSYQLM